MNPSKKELLGMTAELQSEIAKGNKDYKILKSLSLIAEVMKVQHAQELLETQGISPLYVYLDGIMRQASTSKVKAVQNLTKDINFRSALLKTTSLYEKNVLHPKLIELKDIVGEKIKNGTKIIIFNQYRDNAVSIVEEMNKVEGVECKLFVGQAKKKNTGLTQKEQKKILDEFREGLFNVVCMTSVGEEGLDIPKVDNVIFYEPIPSTIRHIQRRGRTGRFEKGEVIILITKDTRDVAYRWSAYHKEKRMYKTLKSLKTKLPNIEKKQKVLKDYSDKLRVVADHREKSSGVIKELIELGIELDLERLDSADYIVSSRVGIEYKTKEDFVNSIVDGRLLSQIKDLVASFEKPLIIVEGIEDIYSIRNVQPHAIQGRLATIAVSYSIPIIYTKSQAETASVIKVIAKREQEEGYKDFSLHGSKKPMTVKEQQEYIISALPGVGAGLAKDLLKTFGNIENIMKASIDELKSVEKIGQKKAEKIRDILEKDY
jgi:Fanconi anemia group M protein